MPQPLTPQQITDVLDMRQLPVEGGWCSQSSRDERCSASYYLLAAPDFSPLDRLARLVTVGRLVAGRHGLLHRRRAGLVPLAVRGLARRGRRARVWLGAGRQLVGLLPGDLVLPSAGGTDQGVPAGDREQRDEEQG